MCMSMCRAVLVQDAADTFFEFNSGQGEISSAIFANDTNITSNANHAKTDAFC